ncbi:MAG: NUDIX domain-containing protein [Thermoplasmata archaeon]|nr:NUDIX domain-containing protein [Thermoplasmata archaeon]
MTGSPEPSVAQECVEGYLFATGPLSLLVLRRPPARGSIWVPVSGKVEKDDRDFPSALRRELAEETGLKGAVGLIDLDWQVRFEGPDGRAWRLHAFGVPVPRSFSPRLSPEHEAFEWLPFVEARARLHYEDNRAAADRLAERVARGPAPNL